MRAPVPPFTEQTARQKVLAAEDAWNTRDPARVAAAYSADTVWRNRSEFVTGREQVEQFLTRKWEREREYVLRKSLWAFTDDRIAVRFQYEWHDSAAVRRASTTSRSASTSAASSVPAGTTSRTPTSRCSKPRQAATRAPAQASSAVG